jgi:hypothetical protein
MGLLNDLFFFIVPVREFTFFLRLAHFVLISGTAEELEGTVPFEVGQLNPYLPAPPADQQPQVPQFAR